MELYASCKGNLVRIHEELVSEGAAFSYTALTAFCRRHGIGHEPRRPAGQYPFESGEVSGLFEATGTRQTALPEHRHEE